MNSSSSIISGLLAVVLENLEKRHAESLARGLAADDSETGVVTERIVSSLQPLHDLLEDLVCSSPIPYKDEHSDAL